MSAASAVFQKLLDEMLLPKLFGRRSDLLRVAFSITDLVHLKDGKGMDWLVDGKDGKALASVDGENRWESIKSAFLHSGVAL